VEIFNATRPGGLDGWTMDVEQYELVRDHILSTLADPRVGDATMLLKDLVASTRTAFAGHPAFPNGRLRNYCTYTKVDLEARGLIERIPPEQPATNPPHRRHRCPSSAPARLTVPHQLLTRTAIAAGWRLAAGGWSNNAGRGRPRSPPLRRRPRYCR